MTITFPKFGEIRPNVNKLKLFPRMTFDIIYLHNVICNRDRDHKFGNQGETERLIVSGHGGDSRRLNHAVNEVHRPHTHARTHDAVIHKRSAAARHDTDIDRPS